MKKKIVQINSTSSGGAFSVVVLLHKSLKSLGLESLVITRFFEYKAEGIYKHSILGDISFKRFLKKAFYPSSLKRNPDLEIFTPPVKSGSVLDSKMVQDADIVHLHWISDLVSSEDIAKLTETKKVFWTLHDMNPFTGGCHHSDNCEQFINGCENCPQLRNGSEVSNYYDEKERSFKKIDRDRLTVISPSKWIYDKAGKSGLLGRFNHVFIPHFVNTELFKYKDVSTARRKVGIDSDKKVFLYISAVLDNNRKGWGKVQEIIQNNKDRKDLLIVLIGNFNGSAVYDDYDCVQFVGNIRDPEVMANYYAASDFLLNFTVAESFGLTTAESLCCGTPVLTYKIPVMMEHIEDGFNGIFVDSGFSDVLSLSVLNRKNISDKACEKYGIKNFREYMDLYNK